MVGALEYREFSEKSLAISDHEMVSMPFWNGSLYDDFFRKQG